MKMEKHLSSVSIETILRAAVIRFDGGVISFLRV